MPASAEPARASVPPEDVPPSPPAGGVGPPHPGQPPVLTNQERCAVLVYAIGRPDIERQ